MKYYCNYNVLIRQHHTKTANMYSDKYEETLQTKAIFQARSSWRPARTWFKNIHISKIFPSYLYNFSDCSTVKWYCDNIKYHGNYALMIYRNIVITHSYSNIILTVPTNLNTSTAIPLSHDAVNFSITWSTHSCMMGTI